MEFSRPEYWSGSPFLSPDLPNPGIEPRSPTLQADAILSEPPGKPFLTSNRLKRTILPLSVLWPAVYLTNKRYCFNPENSQEFKYAFFFPFNFLEISRFCSVLFPFSHASSFSPTSTLNNCGGGQLPSLPKGLGTGDPQSVIPAVTLHLWPQSLQVLRLYLSPVQDLRTQRPEWGHPDVICRILPCAQSSPIPTLVWSLQPTQEVISPGVPILWL